MASIYRCGHILLAYILAESITCQRTLDRRLVAHLERKHFSILVLCKCCHPLHTRGVSVSGTGKARAVYLMQRYRFAPTHRGQLFEPFENCETISLDMRDEATGLSILQRLDPIGRALSHGLVFFTGTPTKTLLYMETTSVTVNKADRDCIMQRKDVQMWTQ